MHRTRIKICGITRPDDARLAAVAGADAIGMIFYGQAKRCVSLEQARSILAALPAFVTPVGIFVDEQVETIRQKTTALGLTHVQLNGRETVEQVEQLRGFRIIKAVRVDPASFEQEMESWRRALEAGRIELSGFVLETAHTAQAGGTGVENDWAAIADFQAKGIFEGLPPIILAGGLRPEIVGRCVSDLRPWAVDVSSGVERSPSQKSAEKIAAFVQAVRTADAATAPDVR